MTLQEAINKFKNIESWLYDGAHESPEFHHYDRELRSAIEAVKEAAELYARSKWDEGAWESFLINHELHSYRKPEFKP